MKYNTNLIKLIEKFFYVILNQGLGALCVIVLVVILAIENIVTLVSQKNGRQNRKSSKNRKLQSY